MTRTTTLLAAALIALPATVFAQDWNGAYGGIQLGGSDIETSGAASLTGDGTSYGLFAGYNIAAGNLVYGAEIDYDSTSYEIAGGAQEVDSTARLKGRIGTLLGSGLGYVAAGWVDASSPGLGDGSGYLYGIGYDAPVADNITIGGELLQHEFEDYNNSGIDVSVTTFKARLAFQF